MGKKTRCSVSDSGDGHDGMLAPTRIRRHYTCGECNLKTTNPREFLYHRKDYHHEKVKIVECPHCQYACQYSQKLQRHVLLVHKINHKILTNNSRLSNKKSLDKPKPNEDDPIWDDNSSEFGYTGSFYSGDDFIFNPEEMVITPDIPYYTSTDIFSSSSSYSSGAEDYSNMYTSVRGLSNCMANSILQPNIRYISPPPYQRMFPVKPRKLFRCAYCKFSHYSHSRIVSHLSSHAGRKPYKCKYCSFSSNYKEVVVHHLSSRHDKRSSKEVLQLVKYTVSKLICRIVDHNENDKDFLKDKVDRGTNKADLLHQEQENLNGILKETCNDDNDGDQK